MNVITMSAIMVTLFLGGPAGPGAGFGPAVDRGASVWFLVKLLVFLFVYVWFRATLPRLRYDQLMDLGWKVLIPLSLGWLVMLAAITCRGTRAGTRAWSSSSASSVLVRRLRSASPPAVRTGAAPT